MQQYPFPFNRSRFINILIVIILGLNAVLTPTSVAMAAPKESRLAGTFSTVQATGDQEPLLATTGTISGTVYEADGSTPIQNAVVEAEFTDGAWGNSGTTDASGAYTIPNLTVGDYIVTTRKSGYSLERYQETLIWDEATPVSVIADQDIPGINFTLDPGGTISGTVYEEDGTTPISNMIVSFNGTGFGEQVCTDSNGFYSFDTVPYDVAVRVSAARGNNWCGGSNAFAWEYWEEVTSWDGATTLTLNESLTTINGIDFTLELGGVISGSVYETDGTTPIENANVWVEEYDSGNWNAYALTDASGNYTITGLNPGNYRVTSTANGYVREYYQETYGWNKATPVTVVGTQETSGIDFTLEPGGTVSGTVYETDGTTPVPYVGVNLDSDDFGIGICTDGNGDFTFEHVPLNVQFRARAVAPWSNCANEPSTFSQEWWSEKISWSTADIFQLTDGSPNKTGVIFTLEEGGSISGTVYESDGTTPIPNARIRIEFYSSGDPVDAINSDANGHYVFYGLHSGDYSLVARKDGYAKEIFEETINWDAATPVPVVAGQDTPDIDFTLDPGGSISGTVYQSDGTTPVQNIAVSLDGVGGGGSCTDSNGDYSLNSVPYNVQFLLRVVPPEENWCGGGPGDNVEMYWQDAYKLEDAELLAVNGNAPDITGKDFTLPQTGYITGTVTDGVDPLENVVVSVQAVGSWSKYWRTLTLIDGTYTLLVPEGDYTVIAKKRGYAWELYDDTRVWTDTTPVSVVNGSPQTGIDFVLGNITFNTDATTYNGYVSGTALTLDPQRTADIVSVDHIDNLFVKLTAFDLDTDTVVGEAATDWSGTQTGGTYTYTFNLRSDIPWVEHDPKTGTTTQAMDGATARYVTAYDFEYSIKRLCDLRESPSYFKDIVADLLVGCREALDEPIPANIPAKLAAVGVTATSATTLEIELNFPATYFLTVTSMWPLAAVPQWTIEQYGRGNWTEAGNIVTSGRYVLDVWKHNSEITLLRNTYMPVDMKGSGNIERISHYQNPDDTTGAIGYSYWTNDQIEVAKVPEDQIQNHKSTFPNEAELISSTGVLYLGFRMTKAPFDNVHLRRAFSAALDRGAFVESVSKGLGEPMIHFTPPSMIGAPPINEVGVGYDPLYAQDQLTLAGYPGCAGLPQIEIMTMAPDSPRPNYFLMTQFAVQQWETQLGCNGKFTIEEAADFSEFLNRLNGSDDIAPHIFPLGWFADYPDANNYVGDVLHCDKDWRIGRTCNSIDTKIEDARVVTNPVARKLLYAEIEDQFFGINGEFPLAPIFLREDYTAVHSWLDWKPTSYAGEQWYNWTLGPKVDPTGQISGHVYQSDGSTPIPDMAVSLLADTYEIQRCTDGSGVFTFDTLEFDTEFRVSAVPDWRCAGQPEGYVHEYWQDAYIREAATPITLTDLNPTDSSVLFTLDAGETTSAPIGTSGGSVSTTEVNLTVPANAITEELTFTITDAGVGYQATTNHGNIEAVASVIIGPEGTAFAEPATLTFDWPDDNSDGIVDGTSIQEVDLYLSKNGVLIAGSCGTDPRCDVDTNTFTVQVTSLSTFVIGPLESIPPTVFSIKRLDPSPTSKKSVDFLVTFSEEVTGVDATDFTLVKTGGIIGYSITGVTPAAGPADTYTVTVNTGKLNGTLKLNVNDTGTGIKDLPGNDLNGGFTAGEVYTVKKRISLRSQATYDGWVLEKTETSNTGGSLNRTGHLFVGDNAQDKQYRAILSFKTAGIPDNAIITRVFLKIKRAGLVGTNPFNTHFNLLADIRKAPFSSNNALQLTDFQASASMNAAGVFNKTLKAGNWYQVTMKSTSGKYVNKKGVTQFRLRFSKDDNDDLNADYLEFFSGNYSNPKYRPLLIIDYYVP